MSKHKASHKHQPLTKWSYSAWATLNKCAYQFFGKYVLGIIDPGGTNRFIDRGNELHAKAEGYLKGTVSSLPKDFSELRRPYKELRRFNPIVEEFWGVDTNWRKSKWNSWCVIKMDAAIKPCHATDNVLVMQDLKTGKVYPDNEKQADLYVAVSLAWFPRMEGASVEFWYADQGGQVITYDYTRKNILYQQKYWMEEGRRVVTPMRRYLASPTPDNCRWCHIRSDRHGSCTAWKDL